MKIFIISAVILLVSTSNCLGQQLVFDTLLIKMSLYIDEDLYRYVTIFVDTDDVKEKYVDELDCDSFLKQKDELDRVLIIHPSVMHSLLLPKGACFKATNAVIKHGQLRNRCDLHYLWLRDAEIVFVEIEKNELKNILSHSHWVDSVFPIDGVVKIGVILE